MKNHENNTNNDHEINRKRRFSSDPEENDNDYLTLSLTLRPVKPRTTVPPPPSPPPPPSAPLVQPIISPPPPTQDFYATQSPPSIAPAPSRSPLYREAGPSRQPTRSRRNPTQAPREGKSETIPAPYPWATNQRATVHSVNHLLSNEIFTITGEVQCKRCEKAYEMEYDLREKFVEVGTFIAENKSAMHDRAPSVWMNPVLPTCKFCEQENSIKPVISEKKKSINWLFLLLGQMLGCCTLEQLKYFCKHTKNHRTGAKDRVLYLTYLGLCKQLDPSGPFDR